MENLNEKFGKLELEKIEFGGIAHGSNYYSQELIYRKEVIGTNLVRSKGFLNPLIDKFYTIAKETDENKRLCDGFEESEDIGYLCVYWETLEGFANNWHKIDNDGIEL